jgi:hypothetical protein
LYERADPSARRVIETKWEMIIKNSFLGYEKKYRRPNQGREKPNLHKHNKMNGVRDNSI